MPDALWPLMIVLLAGMLLMMMSVLAGMVGMVGLMVRLTADRTRAKVQKMRDPVPGSLLITEAGPPSRNAVFHLNHVTGVITADGIEATAVQFVGLIRTSNWRRPGLSLPVTVDRADPTRFAIEWGQLGSPTEEAMEQATRLATQMRGGHS